MFIVLLTYRVSLEKVNGHLAAHRVFLERNYAAGIFLLSGRKEPRDGGFILARSSSLQELKNILANDPFHIHDIANYKIIQVVPSVAAPELETLIAA